LIPLHPEEFIIVTSKKYENLTEKEISDSGIKTVILAEPFPRNTAAAVLYAVTYMDHNDEDPIMIMLPADHYIKDKNRFVDALKLAIGEAKNGKLVSIGIHPTYPETGYGYIKAKNGEGEILPVERFVEKPDIDTARQYVEEGGYFWNSGIFVWKISSIKKKFIEHMPELYRAFAPLRLLSKQEVAENSSSIWQIKTEIFKDLQSISIDFGIMEKANDRVVIPADFGWADLGTWNSIDDILTPDNNMNRTPEPERVIFINSKNCTAFPEEKNISIVGLENVVVVESGGDILVMEKNSSQEVRKVVEIVKKRNCNKT
jgi:mannose-1-phosphate guanylyltransferase